MEKIKVISIMPVAGKKFESVKLSDGRSATVWNGNDGNKNLANAIRQNLNVECEAELKAYNGANGIGYNIRAFAPGNITPEAEVVKSESSNVVEPQSSNVIRKSVKGSAYEKDPVGLAVEVFNNIYDGSKTSGEVVNTIELMKMCTELVKQAQEAFK